VTAARSPRRPLRQDRTHRPSALDDGREAVLAESDGATRPDVPDPEAVSAARARLAAAFARLDGGWDVRLGGSVP
jgi:hypothetical protein